MSSKPNIAIIGAGLGGLTAAILLQKSGHHVKVYEQASQLDHLGAGINISPNAVRVIRRTGLLDRMLQIGLVPRKRYSRDWDTGAVTFDVPVNRYPELYGEPHLIMHRGDLQALLSGAVALGTVELRKRLAGFKETASGVSLSFADGSQAEADIVVGADGINSKIREILLGQERPLYTGTAAYRAIFPVSRIGDTDVIDHTKWWAEDRNILIYFVSSKRDLIYFVTQAPQADWPNEAFAPVPADLNVMRSTFEGFHPEVQRILAACPEASCSPLLERDPLPLWSHGRVVMLGDACHPMRPHMAQGAAMAFEDAAMLVRCIDHMGFDDPQALFKLYEARRFERASKVQDASRTDEWLHYPMDPGWVYGYDVMSVPLVSGVDRKAEAVH